MMSSPCTFLLKRRRAFSKDSPSCITTSATQIHLRSMPAIIIVVEWGPPPSATGQHLSGVSNEPRTLKSSTIFVEPPSPDEISRSSVFTQSIPSVTLCLRLVICFARCRARGNCKAQRERAGAALATRQSLATPETAATLSNIARIDCRRPATGQQTCP